MLRRTTATAVVAATVALTTATPVHADTPSFLGSIECGTNGGSGCTVLLKWLQENGYAPGTPSTGSGSGQESGGSEWDAVDWDAIDWDAVDWDAVDWDAIDWDAIDYDGTDGEEPANPELIIQESLDSFEVPRPEIATSPGIDSPILVRTPVWLWIDSGIWEPATANAEVPGLSLDLTATPTQVRWFMGDGSEVVCDGPGTPFDPAVHEPDAESPDCGHIYERASLADPDATYTLRAEVTWAVAYDFSDGNSGELDALVTSAETALMVREAQSLVTETGA
ncbi:hypothetical protein [Marinitenerispora sediminis]|uniref:ATP/GTP-binding protein n=1 Tax=Marinitenerispora sediminis TaxID=1931232 RepID=A0A368T6H6_9ACTN|nr:hypothetical protein [Marinitenerispora sediminis]RCV49280.1 hypothetical protein DEF28_21295 [Marinitenerispora sediminis]RCV56190.1 hypothetical protein DEF24_16995 [Marinitenerispora sediminis]RCV57479.1 hypothetical protein DEF23_10505 [Marinitenerispora sediminis]